MTIKLMKLEEGTSCTSPVEVFDQTTDDNGTIKFVRRGNTTGTDTKNMTKGETR